MFHVKCLCLDKRKELWMQLKEDCERLGMTFSPFITGEGLDKDLTYSRTNVDVPKNLKFLYNPSRGHYNAFLSHKKMAEEALSENRDYVLFMEDDAYIIEERFAKFVEEFKIFEQENESWDAIYAGWWMQDKNDGTGNIAAIERWYNYHKKVCIEPVLRMPAITNEISGLHGIILKPPILECIKNCSLGPIDSILNKSLHIFNMYAAYPKVIHTKSTFSYCENSFTQRETL